MVKAQFSSQLPLYMGNKTVLVFSGAPVKNPNETLLQFLKRVLSLDVPMSAWQFDSLTIAQQLTAIDRDLFLKIMPEELEVIVRQKSSKAAPNISALVAFSHRTSCLIATEILKNENEKVEYL